MRTEFYLSLFCGFMSFILSFIISLFIIPEEAFILSVMGGTLFTILLFPCLLYSNKRNNNKYLNIERKKNIHYYYKANGNFYIEKKVLNGNLYLCDNKIIIISIDQKPYLIEELALPLIDELVFDGFNMNICTKGGHKYLFVSNELPQIINILKDKNIIK